MQAGVLPVRQICPAKKRLGRLLAGQAVWWGGVGIA